jgi:hypothetical protein
LVFLKNKYRFLVEVVSLVVPAADLKSIKLERSLARLPDLTLEVSWRVLPTNTFMFKNVVEQLKKAKLSSYTQLCTC